MQQHPIPQNITGFEFKLIGDMTIKQFAYLAGCSLLAYFSFASPFHPLFKLPLAFFLALLGIGLAFIPVGGRPLDRWILSFIRALFSPSQYIFHKEGHPPEFLRVKAVPPNTPSQKMQVAKATAASQKQSTDHFTTYLQTVSPVKEPGLDQKEQDKLASINEAFKEPQEPIVITRFTTPPPQKTIMVEPTPMVQPLPVMQQISSPNIEDLKEQERLSEENRKLREELEQIKKELGIQAGQPKAAEVKEQLMQEALTIEQKLQQALSEKEHLASKLFAIQGKPTPPPLAEQVTPIQAALKQTENVKTMPAQVAKSQGVAGLPHLPNIVSGIIKDDKGNLLPNIIVEVKDSAGNPVRAFKTNKLGQFSASTSLSNGTYTIELEDPQSTYTFDVVAIELTGAAFQSLEIIAKSTETKEKIAERDKIYQSLFGKQQSV